MARDANARGWTIVSDTAWDGYEQIPRWIMGGYTRILDEAADAWGETPPDVVVVQTGVGSLTGAVAGWLDTLPAARRPRLVSAEPKDRRVWWRRSAPAAVSHSPSLRRQRWSACDAPP